MSISSPFSSLRGLSIAFEREGVVEKLRKLDCIVFGWGILGDGGS